MTAFEIYYLDNTGDVACAFSVQFEDVLRAKILAHAMKPADCREMEVWADGTLVRFTIRRGRLSEWSQGACDAADARRHVAGTPPEWTGFAQRNADLAARLAADGGARSPESGQDHIHPNERTRGSSPR